MGKYPDHSCTLLLNKGLNKMGYLNPHSTPYLVVYLVGGDDIEKNKPKFILVNEQSFASKYTEPGVQNALSFN